jgi:hypothetical protein
MVRATLYLSLVYLIIIVAGSHEWSRIIPGVIDRLDDPDKSIRAAAINGLTKIVACRTYHHLSLFDVANDDYS